MLLKARVKQLSNQRLLAVLFLGFASGLPLALTASTLQAWFTQAGVNLMTIGMLSLIGLPYTFKFIWAPLLDYFRLPWLGRYQDWIIILQIGLVISLLMMAHSNPAASPNVLASVACVVAFLSATHDVGVDAYRTVILNQDERGLGVSYSIFAYRVAMLLSGGFSLVLADHIGWRMTYELMAVFMLLCCLPTWLAPPVKVAVSTTQSSLMSTTWSALKDLLDRDNILLLLLLIVLYKLGDALALQLLTNFLLHGLGFSLTEVGLAYKVVSFIATIAGAFVGGLLLTRWDIYRALLMFGLFQALSNLMFVLLSMVGKHFLLMMLAIFVENFCSGLSTAALFAFMMSLCRSEFSASQFALLSAVASLGRVFLGPVASALVLKLGWTEFFIFAFVLSFPGLVILLMVKNKVMAYAHALE